VFFVVVPICYCWGAFVAYIFFVFVLFFVLRGLVKRNKKGRTREQQLQEREEVGGRGK
jgi:membrane protein implicated in regulation of membrane protease activity